MPDVILFKYLIIRSSSDQVYLPGISLSCRLSRNSTLLLEVFLRPGVFRIPTQGGCLAPVRPSLAPPAPAPACSVIFRKQSKPTEKTNWIVKSQHCGEPRLAPQIICQSKYELCGVEVTHLSYNCWWSSFHLWCWHGASNSFSRHADWQPMAPQTNHLSALWLSWLRLQSGVAGMTGEGQAYRPPPVERFAPQFVLLLIILRLLPPHLPHWAVSGVPVEGGGVLTLTDVLLDRCQDVVAGRSVVSGPASLATVLSVVKQMMIVFLAASHAASNQTWGL